MDFSGYASSFESLYAVPIYERGFRCEEFLAAVYEAETEGSEGKIMSAKAKALIVEKVTESRDQSELKDLRQQI